MTYATISMLSRFSPLKTGGDSDEEMEAAGIEPAQDSPRSEGFPRRVAAV
jgi:hypothetical protein